MLVGLAVAMVVGDGGGGGGKGGVSGDSGGSCVRGGASDGDGACEAVLLIDAFVPSQWFS